MASWWIPLGLAVLGVFALGAGGCSPLWGRRRTPRLVCGGLGVVCLIAATAGMGLFLTANENRPSATEPAALTLEEMQGKLRVGTPAPDFTLPPVGGEKPVHLADLIGRRPVVLVLGSFRCAYFCNRLDLVQDLYARFKPRAEFLFVYIDNDHRGQEADWLKAIQTDPSAPTDAPVNRLPRIRAGLQHYDLTLPCVDDFDEKQTLQAYRASPAKLVIIDQAGLVAYDSGSVTNSGLGPEEVASWLEQHTEAPR